MGQLAHLQDDQKAGMRWLKGSPICTFRLDGTISLNWTLCLVLMTKF